MLKILVICPGTTEFDLEGRILGTLDVPLSNGAASEVTESIRQLDGQSIDALYSSPSQSSQQTAETSEQRLLYKKQNARPTD